MSNTIVLVSNTFIFRVFKSCVSVPSFKSLKGKPPQKEDTQIVGFHVTKEEHEILQDYANRMYNQIYQNPQTGQKERVIDKPQIGLMIKKGTFYFMQMFNFQLQMTQQQNNPQLQQALSTVANQLGLGQNNVGR